MILKVEFCCILDLRLFVFVVLLLIMLLLRLLVLRLRLLFDSCVFCWLFVLEDICGVVMCGGLGVIGEVLRDIYVLFNDVVVL